MKKTLSIVLLVVVLMLGACSVPEPTEFTSEAGKFSIMTPVTLTEQTQSVPTTVGDITTYMFVGESGNDAYVVGYSDYPAEVMAQSDPQTMLNGARDGALKNVNGTLTSEQAITIGNYPGIELVANIKDASGQEGTLKSHIYLVENRLYQVMAISSKGSFDAAKVDAFLDSFKLTGQ